LVYGKRKRFAQRQACSFQRGVMRRSPARHRQTIRHTTTRGTWLLPALNGGVSAMVIR
jgi:hypothetical protein